MPILQAETAIHPLNLLTRPAKSDPTRQWWAVYTKARQEKAVARQLLAYDIPYYLPLVPKDNLIRGKRVRSHLPLFGGYLFLFASEEERVRTLTTNRISTILPVDNQDRLRQDLRHVATLIAADAPLTVEKRLARGDQVQVKSGPMTGVQGTVVSRKGKSRLLVAVTMLQQGVSVEIDDFLLEPV